MNVEGLCDNKAALFNVFLPFFSFTLFLLFRDEAIAATAVDLSSKIMQRSEKNLCNFLC